MKNKKIINILVCGLMMICASRAQAQSTLEYAGQSSLKSGISEKSKTREKYRDQLQEEAYDSQIVNPSTSSVWNLYDAEGRFINSGAPQIRQTATFQQIGDQKTLERQYIEETKGKTPTKKVQYEKQTQVSSGPEVFRGLPIGPQEFLKRVREMAGNQTEEEESDKDKDE